MNITEILSEVDFDSLTEESAAEYSRQSTIRAEKSPMLGEQFRAVLSLLDSSLVNLTQLQMLVPDKAVSVALIGRLRKYVNCARTQYCQIG